MGMWEQAMDDGSLLTLGVAGLLALGTALAGGTGAPRYGGGNVAGSRSQYTDFMADRLPYYTGQGYNTQDAMRRAAAEWRSMHAGA
jgi:hypothetical protein